MNRTPTTGPSPLSGERGRLARCSRRLADCSSLASVNRLSSLCLSAFAFLAAFGAAAQNVQHLAIPVPGGMPGLPLITGITPVTNGIKVMWDGPPGYYQLFESQTSNNPVWVPLTKHNNLLRTATIPGRYSNAFFKVTGPAPKYAGSQTCAECHAPVLKTAVHTLHFSAFSNSLFAADGGQTSNSCLTCHTVGFDLPTGFASASLSPRLAAVECENCHGPAARHAANPDDPSARPRADVAATVCGGCHNDPHHPTFDEWTNSAHSLNPTNHPFTGPLFAALGPVIPDMNPSTRLNHCGRCHSASERLSLLDHTPAPTGDADIGIVCATCHNPHQTNSYPAQLRNPLASLDDYFMPTNGTFAKLYNTNINLCAQCHNHAGASWTNNACEPHHSPQYNMLLGTVGELEDGLPPSQPAMHALGITNQCVGCHMQSSPFVSDAQPAVTGHSFKVQQYGVCIPCHGTISVNGTNASTAGLLVPLWTNAIAGEIQQVVFDLNYWAAHAAPSALAKYGNLAWEYTTPGSLSSGGPGPNASEQKLIPDIIRKARFNLYLVQNDGSFGVHNGPYANTLLDAAENWIQEALNP